MSASGGCLCGSVRYSAEPDAASAYYCHCRDCQIGSGSAFHVAVLAPDESFRLHGSTAVYSKQADSGNDIHRHFCPNCGTVLFWTGDGFLGTVVLTLSSLDNHESITPNKEVWTDSAVSWCHIQQGLSRFKRRPVA